MKFSMLVIQTAICLAISAPLAMAAQGNNANWRKNHPRRAQVERRDHRLEKRTARAEKNGKITEGQADKLEGEEQAIHNQEKADAAANGGHITKAEQRDLNREENGVRHELRRDERRDRRHARNGATPANPATPASGGAPATPATPATPPAGN